MNLAQELNHVHAAGMGHFVGKRIDHEAVKDMIDRTQPADARVGLGRAGLDPHVLDTVKVFGNGDKVIRVWLIGGWIEGRRYDRKSSAVQPARQLAVRI